MLFHDLYGNSIKIHNISILCIVLPLFLPGEKLLTMLVEAEKKKGVVRNQRTTPFFRIITYLLLTVY
jgi:hypothetical protein